MPAHQHPEIGDASLLKLLKTPPESREQIKEKVKAWKEQERASSSTGKKRGPSF